MLACSVCAMGNLVIVPHIMATMYQDRYRYSAWGVCLCPTMARGRVQYRTGTSAIQAHLPNIMQWNVVVSLVLRGERIYPPSLKLNYTSNSIIAHLLTSAATNHNPRHKNSLHRTMCDPYSTKFPTLEHMPVIPVRVLPLT